MTCFRAIRTPPPRLWCSVRAVTAPTVDAALADLARLGIVQEVSGRRRGRVYAYRAYLDILNEGTAPLATSA